MAKYTGFELEHGQTIILVSAEDGLTTIEAFDGGWNGIKMQLFLTDQDVASLQGALEKTKKPETVKTVTIIDNGHGYYGETVRFSHKDSGGNYICYYKDSPYPDVFRGDQLSASKTQAS